jgi:hypothetical protein
MKTSVEWLSNQAYELFEQYSEGNFDRITLNKLMLEATKKAKEMEKEQIIDAYIEASENPALILDDAEQYYNETFKQD